MRCLFPLPIPMYQTPPKRNGGLGIRNLDVLNDPLLGKWLWRYALECNYLGRKIIQGKYGEVEGG